MSQVSLLGRVWSAVQAFREAFLIAGIEGAQSPTGAIYDYNSYQGRVTRYDILWAYFQGSAYRNIRKWAESMKADYELYAHIRDIYNPAHRICSFHRRHIWGGHLDVKAGDGSEVPSALPVKEASDGMQGVIENLWDASRMEVVKDKIVLHGAVFGDVFLKIIPDKNQDLVYFDRIHPAWVAEVQKDAFDRVIAYTLNYERSDPEKEDPRDMVQYTEEAVLTEGGVQYRLMRDKQPYPWDGNPPEWVIPYPFIPFVHIMHDDIGDAWGWSELFPHMSKFREVDDQASKLGDQIRKMVDAPWLITGVRGGSKGGVGDLTVEGRDSTTPLSGALGKTEAPLLLANNPDTKASPLVTTDLDLMGVLENIREITAEIEKSYPELRVALGRRLGSGDISGRALLLAQQEAVDKVEERRTGYDEKMVRVHRMAAAVGGHEEIPGYEGFKLEDFNKEATFHRIEARRPVFRPHPTEAAQEERDLWINAALAQRAGVSLEIFLRDRGWEESRIQQILESEFYKDFLKRLENEASGTRGLDATGSGSAFVKDPSSEAEGDVDFNQSVLTGREG